MAERRHPQHLSGLAGGNAPEARARQALQELAAAKLELELARESSSGIIRDRLISVRALVRIAHEELAKVLEFMEGPPPEACPGCGVTDSPHRDGCPHDAALAAAAMKKARPELPPVYYARQVPNRLVVDVDGELFLVPMRRGGWCERARFFGGRAGLVRVLEAEARLQLLTTGWEPPHVHTRDCYEDPGPAHGSPFRACGLWTPEELAALASSAPAAVECTHCGRPGEWEPCPLCREPRCAECPHPTACQPSTSGGASHD